MKVSIIIPTFNNQLTLSKALDSVLNQTFQDFEVLVCDDASTDSTCNLVKDYLKKSSKIKLLSLPFNQGAGAARNMGMRSSLGEYIAFLDSDDEWHPEKLARQVQCLDQEPLTVGVCFCGGTIIKNKDNNKRKKYIPKRNWEKKTFRKFVCDNIYFLTPAIMFRRTCLQVSGMMVPEMRRNQDGEFLLRLFNNFNLAVIPDDLVTVHLDTNPKRIKNHYELMKNAYPFWERHFELIQDKTGILPSLKYLGTRRTNLMTAAIREHLWENARKELIKRLSILPLLWPAEITKIGRALYKAFSSGRYKQTLI